MAGAQARSFDVPDERRTPPKTSVDIVRLGQTTAGRYTFEPGWRWSETVKPLVGTDSCRLRHVGVVLTGRLHISHEDGTEAEAGPGEAFVVEPGHDAWVVGDEAYTAYEFESASAEDFAKG
jgi:hypothetical protein